MARPVPLTSYINLQARRSSERLDQRPDSIRDDSLPAPPFFFALPSISYCRISPQK